MGKRFKTKYDGVFYRESKTNGNNDKTYYVRYKDKDNIDVEVKVGKHSEGIRINYCYQKRLEVVNKINKNLNIDKVILRRTKKNQVLFKTEYEKYIESRVKDADGVYTRGIKEVISKYKNHIEPSLADKDISLIDLDDIEKIRDEKREIGLSKSTIDLILCHIRIIINHSIEHNPKMKNIPNIMKNIKLYKDNETRERYLSKDEVQLLIKKIETENDIDLLIGVRILLETGARKRTLFNVSYEDIDFNTNKIDLYDLKKQVKTDKFYTGYLTDETIDLIKSNKLCSDNRLMGYSVSTLDIRLNKVLNELFNNKLPEKHKKHKNKYKVFIHTLRHTFGSSLVSKKVDIYVIQKLMNHKDIRQTIKYSKVAEEVKVSAVNGLYD